MGAEAGGRCAVLVVGAGPVGLVLACELARRDVPIRVVDKRPEPTDESRAIVVHARSLELMERVGMVEPLIASGVRTLASEFHADGQVLGRVELDTVDSPYPFSISTAQTETERVLTERLTQLGVTVERGVELLRFEQDDEAVRATLRLADGSEQAVSADYIAGTDGSHSTVRAQLGMKLEGSFKGERFLLGDVDADYELDRDAMHMFFSADDGPLLVFPMRDDRVRVIAQLTDQAANDREPSQEWLQAICDSRGGGLKLRTSRWLTIFEIHHAQVPQYRHGRAFLAGDAAHVHSPAGAQGMNTGIQDAFNLGWKLALAAGGQAAPGLLDSYHAERHPIAARVIKQTTRMTKAGTMDGGLARKLRNSALHIAAGLAPIRHRLAKQIEETDIAYLDSPLSVSVAGHGHHPRAGEAARDVPDVEPALHSVLARAVGHAALVIAPTGAAADLIAPPAAAASLFQVLVAEAPPSDVGFDALVADPMRRVADRYGLDDDGGLVLVRPDGYVGLRTRLDDAEAVAAYFARVFG